MKTWTPQAEKRLAEYLEERVRREGFDGEEASELRSDLSRHIHEESEKETASSIGLMQLEGILGRLDAGYRPAQTPSREQKPISRLRPFWAWTWGVVMPTAILLIELITSFCGGVFFSPLPTGWHVLLVALVPATNAWFLTGARRGGEMTKGFLATFATVIAVLYGLLFLPLFPLSLFALILLGMGLLSLTPVFSGIWTWRIARRQRLTSMNPARFRRGAWIGLASAFCSLILLEGSSLWTRVQFSHALAEGNEAKVAIERLRAFHSEETLVRVCYEITGGFGSTPDIVGWVLQLPNWTGVGRGNRFTSTESSLRVHETFFRITGKALTGLRPPRSSSSWTPRRQADQSWEFDNHVGSDDVAVRLKHLDLSQSRFDGHFDPRSRLGYGEWTLVFKNQARNPHEARCQIRLPRGGHVSRLTLWVNGEPREAAFNAVSKVKSAYRAIAVVERRDPVLVTTRGQDTVMVQCFPVPAGGEMKIRLGITAPFEGGSWELPRIVERNFGFTENLEHAVWLQSEGAFAFEEGNDSRASRVDGPGHSFSTCLPSEALNDKALVIKPDHLSPDAPVVWCEDKFAPAHERYLIRTPEKILRKPSGKPLLVLDDSAALNEAKDWLIPALRAWPHEILLADDGARSITPAELESLHFSGGRDNGPALHEAVRRAKAGEIGDIIWLHGPQPIALSHTESLLQLLERGTTRPAIHDIAIIAGPNRLAEILNMNLALRRGPAVTNQSNLAAFLQSVSSEQEQRTWRWERSATPPDKLGPPVWDHLARQWAAERTDTPGILVTGNELPALAARYQIVTPISGAVVLETAEQYRQHGLEPIDPNSAPQIPSVPEPSSTLLILLTATAATLHRRRPAA